jgi:hypothetical protein
MSSDESRKQHFTPNHEFASEFRFLMGDKWLCLANPMGKKKEKEEARGGMVREPVARIQSQK